MAGAGNDRIVVRTHGNGSGKIITIGQAVIGVRPRRRESRHAGCQGLGCVGVLRVAAGCIVGFQPIGVIAVHVKPGVSEGGNSTANGSERCEVRAVEKFAALNLEAVLIA